MALTQQELEERKAFRIEHPSSSLSGKYPIVFFKLQLEVHISIKTQKWVVCMVLARVFPNLRNPTAVLPRVG
jgi:hypothetical protein